MHSLLMTAAAGGAVAAARMVSDATGRLAETSFAQWLTGSEESPEEASATVGDSIAQLQQQWEAASRDLQQAIREQLAAGGIELGGPLRLQQDRFGDFEVAGEHPQEDRIEMILNGNTRLRELLGNWSRVGSALQQHAQQDQAHRLEAIDVHAAAAWRAQMSRRSAPLELVVRPEESLQA